ncbi:6-phosphogluconolactonase [Candidatus Pacearchaeota archaeon]|nr:6-phosphogluconolactonase [Candidatus Pacearchaeota archaeon]|tara:strand:- start:1087 stop:1743 length:657 start_codon:yes stop_codon:yes gene_type:complete
MEIIKYKDREDIEKYASDYISDKITEVLREKPHVTLGAVGGTSVKGIYSKLSKKDLEWDKVHVFMVDERYVPIDHEDSNFKLVKENLRNGNLHPFHYDQPLSNYLEEFNTYGNFDIVLLSSGEDGHIGALYPNHHSVKNNSLEFISMEDSPKPPPKRMTASRRLIENADCGILLFFGEGKTDAYNQFKYKDQSVTERPTQLLKNLKQGLVLVSSNSKQ